MHGFPLYLCMHTHWLGQYGYGNINRHGYRNLRSELMPQSPQMFFWVYFRCTPLFLKTQRTVLSHQPMIHLHSHLFIKGGSNAIGHVSSWWVSLVWAAGECRWTPRGFTLCLHVAGNPPEIVLDTGVHWPIKLRHSGVWVAHMQDWEVGGILQDLSICGSHTF